MLYNDDQLWLTSDRPDLSSYWQDSNFQTYKYISGHEPHKGHGTKIDRLTDRQSQGDSDSDCGAILRRQLKEEEVDVRWSPASEDMSAEAKGRLLLEDINKQRNEDRD
jgi:hypothetical protein